MLRLSLSNRASATLRLSLASAVACFGCRSAQRSTAQCSALSTTPTTDNPQPITDNRQRTTDNPQQITIGYVRGYKDVRQYVPTAPTMLRLRLLRLSLSTAQHSAHNRQCFGSVALRSARRRQPTTDSRQRITDNR